MKRRLTLVMSLFLIVVILAAVAFLIKKNREWDAIDAVNKRDFSKLVLMLKSEELDPNHNLPGRYSLMSFAANNHLIELIGVLIQKGAKVDLVDEGGWTPLQYAASNGDLEIVKMLLNAGADVNKNGPSGAPVYLAAANGNYDVFSYLLSRGADTSSNSSVGSVFDAVTAGAYLAHKEGSEKEGEYNKMMKILIERRAGLDTKK